MSRVHLALLALVAVSAGGCGTHASVSDAALDGASDGGAGNDDGTVSADGGDGGCVVGAGTFGEPTTLACAQSTPAKLATDGANIYWTVEAYGAVLMKVASGGGAPQVLATSDAGAFGLVLDAAYAYLRSRWRDGSSACRWPAGRP